MSQHDFNIANQTFPSFRADLNDALVAAATMSAGSSAPTTPYPYQLWFDTTTGTWKVRNSGNTAWVSTITTDLATGNVGIGTSSPADILDASFSNNSGSAVGLQVKNTNTGTSGNYAGLYATAVNGAIGMRLNAVQSTSLSARVQLGSTTAHPVSFVTSDTERFRVSGGGNVLFGCQVFPSASVQGFSITGTSSGQASSSGSSTAAYNHLLFYNGNGLIGYISTSGSTTTYANISDYRLKTDVTYDWDATTRLKQLKPARFEWIADGDDAVPVDGFLAHEVQDIVPEAIVGEKDGMRDEEYEVSAATGDIYTPAVAATYDEDGVELTAAIDEVIHSADVEQPEELAEGQQWRETTAAVMGTRSVPDYQGIDQSKLVPLLVKTIQELEARITALEAS
jgi:hypothetical protein